MRWASQKRFIKNYCSSPHPYSQLLQFLTISIKFLWKLVSRERTGKRRGTNGPFHVLLSFLVQSYKTSYEYLRFTSFEFSSQSIPFFLRKKMFISFLKTDARIPAHVLRIRGGAQAGWIFLNNYYEQNRGYETKYGISSKTNIENKKDNAKVQLFESKCLNKNNVNSDLLFQNILCNSCFIFFCHVRQQPYNCRRLWKRISSILIYYRSTSFPINGLSVWNTFIVYNTNKYYRF